MSDSDLLLPRRALLSVTDKGGLLTLAEALHDQGCELVSSTGTAQAIRDGGLPVIETATVSGVPPMMDNRVVTMHPKIVGGILADRDLATHLQDLVDHEITAIDLVVCNLYPFINSPSIKNIDVGGPTMLRSGGKNHAHVCVIVDPLDYARVIVELRDGGITAELRQELAGKAFRHTATYDDAIATWYEAGCPEPAAA